MAIARALASDEGDDDDDGEASDFEDEGALVAPLGVPFDRVCTMDTLAVAAMRCQEKKRGK